MSNVKRFTLGLAVLALVVGTVFAALATPFATSGGAPGTSVELDIDAPKRPKLKAPTGPKVTAPALRAPSTKRR